MPYIEQNRTQRPGIVSVNSRVGVSWDTLTAEIVCDQFSGCFIGLDATGKHVLAAGANVKTMLGWMEHKAMADTKKFPVGTQVAFHANNGTTFQLGVSDKTKIKTMKIGDKFGLKLDAAGRQVIDTASTGADAWVIVIDPTLPGEAHGMVRVRLDNTKTVFA